MAKFAIALREIATYKEVLRSQEARKRFDKANVAYDQVREKFLSLRKSTRMDIAAAIEGNKHQATSNLVVIPGTLQCKVGALSAVEAKGSMNFGSCWHMMETHAVHRPEFKDILRDAQGMNFASNGAFINQQLCKTRYGVVVDDIFEHQKSFSPTS
ncbi:ankyrin repeat and PH [Datura stramonium]|uniref:Ankyrin repeat and PH n=1 Tax=Datura stramonium TaxID=4076 RepID=A0ABS8RYJ0_DATST|nr:ankyrin repeat and PH [Datura stramonium]